MATVKFTIFMNNRQVVSYS